nr:MAG TPA: cohesin subunit [Caudoviricetes sp.]
MRLYRELVSYLTFLPPTVVNHGVEDYIKI